MHDPMDARPPAPVSSPVELLRVTEFEFLPGAFEGAES